MNQRVKYPGLQDRPRVRQMEFTGLWKQDDEKNDHEDYGLIASLRPSGSDGAWFPNFKQLAGSSSP